MFSKNKEKENLEFDKVLEKYKNTYDIDITLSSKKILKSTKIQIEKKAWKNNTKDKIHYVFLDFDWKRNLNNFLEKTLNNDVVSIGVTLPTTSWLFGRTTNSLVNIGYKEIKKLIDQGVPSKNIIIDGLCLTSAIGTKIAKKLLDQGIVVNLFNDRSFSTTRNHCSEDIKEMELYNKSHHPIKKIGYRITDTLLVPIITCKTRKVGNTFVKVYTANPDRINYSVYRSMKDDKGNREPDKTIAHVNSIHKNPELKAIRVASKKPAKDAIKLIKWIQESDKNLSPQETVNLAKAINIKMEEYKNVKYQETNIKNNNIELFISVIEAIHKGDLDCAIDHLQMVCFFINANHKYEKIYSEEDFKKIKLAKKFEKVYHKIYTNDPEEKNMKNEFNVQCERELHKNFYVPRGHVVGRHYLYSRLYNTTLNTNYTLQQDKIKPWIKELNAGDAVFDGASVFDMFINDIRELNKKENNKNTKEI